MTAGDSGAAAIAPVIHRRTGETGRGEMRSFFRELERRNVLRAGALYLGAAWELSHPTSRTWFALKS
jgi:hypothetical protein